MINIIVNQQNLAIEQGCTLLQAVELYLQQHQSEQLSNIALVINQNIIPRSFWQSRVCQDQDNIELFSAVAGG